MIDPTQPLASFPPVDEVKAWRKKPEKTWSAFVSHVSRARAKPTFDLEERDYKFEIAERLRGFLEGMRHGLADPLVAAETVFAGVYGGRPYDLSLNISWLPRWARADGKSLIEALSGFTDDEPSPVKRFASFAKIAEEVQAAGTIEANVFEILVHGSLFNFALAPEEAPVLKPWAFSLLESILDHDAPAGASLTQMYENHLAFTDLLRERLVADGLAVRDALDVQSLVSLAAQEHEFWFPPDEPRAVAGNSARRNGGGHSAYLSVCAIYRNEASYLREWIEFHRLVGVERFYLYDNDSTDDHLDVLAPYLEDGSVVLQDWSIFPVPQHQAYDHCLREHGHGSRWIGFIDLDEFLFSPTGRPLPDVLTEYEQWPGVGANMISFGPSGHRTRPPGLVIENYVRSMAPEFMTAIKSIVDPTRTDHCMNAHYFVYKHGMTVDENRFPIWREFTRSPSYSILRLNHYWMKSEQESREKFARARADTGGLRPWPNFPSLRTRDEKLAMDDDLILGYLPPLKEILGLG